jgi:hypothetical protein
MSTTEGLHTKPQVCRGEGQTAYKCALGYQRLGVDPKNLQRVPLFAMQLKNIARAVRGAVGITHAFDLLLGSEDADARKVSDAYHSVPASYRRLLAPEAFCLAAGVPPNRVLDDLQAREVQTRFRWAMQEVRQARCLRRLLVQAYVAGKACAGVHQAGERQGGAANGIGAPYVAGEGRSRDSRTKNGANVFGVLYRTT